MALVISAIAMMALAIPFVAERAFWGSGKAQAESQRDAEMVIRAMAAVAREATAYTPISNGPGYGAISFGRDVSLGGERCFQGGPNSPTNGRFVVHPACAGGVGVGAETVLIDGIRSRVEEFSITSVIPNKLARLRLVVSHHPIVTSPRVEREVLETELFLRNGS